MTQLDFQDGAGVVAGDREPAQPGLIDNPWVSFTARRLGRFVVSLWVLVTAAFLMIQLVPGDPVRSALGLTAPADLVEAKRRSLGLDEPLLTQYWHFLQGILTGDLGTSITTDLPVADTISQRFPATMLLAGAAFLVVAIVAIPLGTTMAALTRGGRRRGVEVAFTGISIVVAAVPGFLIAVCLVYVFAVRLTWLPVAGINGPSSYVLPVLALAIGPTAVMTRLVRIEVLSVLAHDYIRTARAKRLVSRRLYLRHAVPNALTATLTVGGLLLTGMVAGTVFVENVFAWPGLGSTIAQSILAKDYPVVQGTILVYGSLVLVVNLAVDVLLGMLDPRSTIRDS
jgi:peptide/nickel transport system permease protein